MRDLALMEFHRRLKGVGKSNPGELNGVFDIRFGHNKYMGVRKAVCTVRQEQGWQMLQIQMHEKRGAYFSQRTPIPDEVVTIRAMFFEDWETPIQVHRANPYDMQPVRLWWSDDVNRMVLHLPEL